LIWGLLLVLFGAMLLVYGAWGIDFAFQAVMEGRETIHIPFPTPFDVSVGWFWNFNFLVLFTLGSILILTGGYLTGRRCG